MFGKPSLRERESKAGQVGSVLAAAERAVQGMLAKQSPVR